MRSFFEFCIDCDYGITKNPAKALKAPQVKPNPTLPLTDSEIAKLLAHCDFRSQLFFRVLLHSGLRILAAVKLRPEKIVNGKLLLYTAKNGVPVWCPLPPDLLLDLSKLSLVGGFLFAVRSDNPVTIAEYYRVKLEKAAIAAGLAEKRKKGELRGRNEIHLHRFRNTFSVRLLEKGVSIENVATLLGNTVHVCERRYAPWVIGRQTALENAVQGVL